MSFKKTSAFIKGSWDGTPDESNFTQSGTVYASVAEFVNYVDAGITALLNEYEVSGDLIARLDIMSADGKVMICTKEFIDEAAWTAFKADSRWAAEDAVTKLYNVELAPAPEDVNTFDEPTRVYYHSSAHLF